MEFTPKQYFNKILFQPRAKRAAKFLEHYFNQILFQPRAKRAAKILGYYFNICRNRTLRKFSSSLRGGVNSSISPVPSSGKISPSGPDANNR